MEPLQLQLLWWPHFSAICGPYYRLLHPILWGRLPMPFCPVARPSLLRTPGHLPYGLARQQCLWMDALGGNGQSTFFLVLKFLFPWQSERKQTSTLFLPQRKGNPTFATTCRSEVQKVWFYLGFLSSPYRESSLERHPDKRWDHCLGIRAQISLEFPCSGPHLLLQLSLWLLPFRNGWHGAGLGLGWAMTQE